MIDMKTSSLLPGLIVGKNVIGASGQVLVGRGVKLNQRYILQLKEHGIVEVPIMQSIDLLDPLSPDRLRRREVIYEKKVDINETYQTIVNQLIANELKQNVNFHLDTYFIHLVNLEELKRRIEKILVDTCADLHVISFLSMMKCMDYKSIKRYSRVCTIGLLIGIDMGIEYEKLISLAKACLFYNMGHFVLMKNFKVDKLSAWKQEDKLYTSHGTIGSKYLNDFFDEDVSRAALEHHERVSGSGFPNNLSGSEISLVSKIVSVAGRFVSLKHKNGIHTRYHRDLAIDYIFNQEGFQFDSNVVNSFRKQITPYPINSVIELSEGSRGIVIKNGMGPDYFPIIKIQFSKSTMFENGDIVNTQELEAVYITRDLMVY